MTSSAFVSLKKVSVGYAAPKPGWTRKTNSPKPLLSNSNLNLNLGAQIVVYGAAGSGKTTLLKTIAGQIKPLDGAIIINGKKAAPGVAAYISSESRKLSDARLVHKVVTALAKERHSAAVPARVAEVLESTGCTHLVSRRMSELSTAEYVRVSIAAALLQAAPILLLDDAAESLGVQELQKILAAACIGHTVIVATRHASTADALALPVIILNQQSMSQPFSREELTRQTAHPLVVDVWLEGIQYNLVKQLRSEAGITHIRIMPSSIFHGQRLRLTLRSAHYLPLMYELMSRAPVVRVEERPVSFTSLLEYK